MVKSFVLLLLLLTNGSCGGPCLVVCSRGMPGINSPRSTLAKTFFRTWSKNN